MLLSSKNQKGFTLIEMIIAISIFVLVLLIASNIVLTVNNTQRKVVTMQKIQDDVRYLFEALSQEVRLGKINYDFYNNNNINLHPDFGGHDNDILATINQLQEEVYFWKSGKIIKYCKIDVSNPSCDLTDNDIWGDVTPEGVSVLDLSFFITPSADPFIDSADLTCLSNSSCPDDCKSYKWSGSRCEYYADGGNFQPKVQIRLKVRGDASTIAQESEITMQTTVSSRLITGEVQNEFYESW